MTRRVRQWLIKRLYASREHQWEQACDNLYLTVADLDLKLADAQAELKCARNRLRRYDGLDDKEHDDDT